MSVEADLWQMNNSKSEREVLQDSMRAAVIYGLETTALTKRQEVMQQV